VVVARFEPHFSMNKRRLIGMWDSVWEQVNTPRCDIMKTDLTFKEVTENVRNRCNSRYG
jgi:hypothetical protein